MLSMRQVAFNLHYAYLHLGVKLGLVKQEMLYVSIGSGVSGQLDYIIESLKIVSIVYMVQNLLISQSF